MRARLLRLRRPHQRLRHRQGSPQRSRHRHLRRPVHLPRRSARRLGQAATNPAVVEALPSMGIATPVACNRAQLLRLLQPTPLRAPLWRLARVVPRQAAAEPLLPMAIAIRAGCSRARHPSPNRQCQQLLVQPGTCRSQRRLLRTRHAALQTQPGATRASEPEPRARHPPELSSVLAWYESRRQSPETRRRR